MTDIELINAIYVIQQEWWEGEVEMNVALSEIRCLFGQWKNEINPVCGIPGCRDPHRSAENWTSLW